MNLAELRGRVPARGRGLRRAAAEPRAAARATRWRCRAGGCTRRLRSRCGCTPTARRRCEVNHYVVVPFLPRQHVARAALAYARRGKLPTRAAGAHADGASAGGARAPRPRRRAALRARGRGDGDRAARRRAGRARCCGRALTRPRQTGAGARRSAGELLGELDAPVEREAAIQAGLRLREAIAGSSLDFDRDSHLAHVDRDAEQTIVVATTAGRTQHGLAARGDADPPAVHAERVRARARAPPRAPAAEARLPPAVHDQPRRGVRAAGCRTSTATCRSASTRGCSASSPPASRPACSTSRSTRQLRARGPDPDLAALSEAVDFCAEQIESAGDCKVNAGTFRQQQLWESTLPLGRDVLAQVRKYPTVNAADMLPLVGTKCGSPTGIPFAFADPGRTVELLNLYDEQHPNHTLLIAGRSGSGKTMTANVLMSRCLALGRAGVRDRPRRPLRDAVAAGRRRAADRDRRRGLARTR